MKLIKSFYIERHKNCILAFFVIITVYVDAQNIRWTLPLDVGYSISYDGFVASDQFNGSYVLGSISDFMPAVIPYPYPVIGCNDIFLAKYDGNGNLAWRKTFGGHNFKDLPEYNCPSNNENFLGLYANDFNNSILAVFTYTDSIKLDNKTYYGHYPNLFLGQKKNLIMVSFDLNGNILWVNNLVVEATLSFGGLGINTNKIFWAGTATSTNTFLGQDTLKKGSFVVSMDHSGKILKAKNLLFDENNSVDASGMLMNLKLTNNIISVQAQTNESTKKVGALPLSNPQNRSLYQLYLYESLDVQKATLVYQNYPALPFGQPIPTTHYAIDEATKNLVISNIVTENDLLLADDTLKHTSGHTTLYFSGYNQNHIKLWKSQIIALQLKIVKTYFSADGLLYALIESSGYSGNTEPNNIYLPHDTIFNFTHGTLLIGIDNLGNIEVGETFPLFRGTDFTTDSFGRHVFLGACNSGTKLQNVTLSSRFGYELHLFKHSVFPVLTSEPKTYLNIFPNPASSAFEIIIPESALNMVFNLTISDLNGKILFHTATTCPEETVRVNVSHLARGVYNVALESNKDCFSSKLVLIR